MAKITSDFNHARPGKSKPRTTGLSSLNAVFALKNCSFKSHDTNRSEDITKMGSFLSLNKRSPYKVLTSVDDDTTETSEFSKNMIDRLREKNRRQGVVQSVLLLGNNLNFVLRHSSIKKTQVSYLLTPNSRLSKFVIHGNILRSIESQEVLLQHIA